MKIPVLFVIVPSAIAFSCIAAAKDLAEMSVLYIGAERTAEFTDFLKSKVARIESRERDRFKPADAAAFDVVLLDWPQTGSRNFPPKSAPLGTREGWNKPTVLLGSAGLNLAIVWQMKGGSGCTCLDPLAYDLREHEIFQHPRQIDRKRVTSIPTPEDFQTEIKDSQIPVLALVPDPQRKWRPGWCTYAYDFDANPDVEFFAGGVNHKTPTAAALWRQGNLLHFGFEQSPLEMNEDGKNLLLNSIAYIQRFSEDRPIAITLSVFAEPVARPRSYARRLMRYPDLKLETFKPLFVPALWAKLSTMNREQLAEWFQKNEQFLHPEESHNVVPLNKTALKKMIQLEIDEDLVALGVPFDSPEFFGKAIAWLQTDSARAARGRHLLESYARVGPKNGTADQWKAWWQTNKDYLFASDTGDYCWYIDPLAKKRGIATSALRGALRADPQ